MSSNSHAKKPHFHNIKVKIKFMPDGNGNTADNRYKVKGKPSHIPVHHGDAVLNYQLVSAPKGIVFDGFDKISSNPGHQLSKPSISADGKMMTFSDRNSENEAILIILKFRDNSVILFDPEVTNEPIPN